MCPQALQFCSGVTKPLLFAGGLLSFLLAIAIGYTGYSTQTLYHDIDPQVAVDKSLCFHLQLAAAIYLTLVTVFSCYAAHYDQKHSIRVLAGVSTVNFIIAVTAIFLIPSGQELSKPVEDILKQAQAKYNFQDNSTRQTPDFLVGKIAADLVTVSSTSPKSPEAENPRALPQNEEPKAAALVAPTPPTNASSSDRSALEKEGKPRDAPNVENATRIWDNLQYRGCCGLNNAKDWTPKIPKSCCAEPKHEGDDYVCASADQNHQQGCLALIDSGSLNLLIVLALIALVNFYLAAISGLSAYKTLSYSEASQNAYT